jgi:hypothetical protein
MAQDTSVEMPSTAARSQLSLGTNLGQEGRRFPVVTVIVGTLQQWNRLARTAPIDMHYGEVVKGFFTGVSRSVAGPQRTTKHPARRTGIPANADPVEVAISRCYGGIAIPHFHST